MAFKNYTALNHNKTIHDHVLSPDSIFTIYSDEEYYKKLFITK